MDQDWEDWGLAIIFIIGIMSCFLFACYKMYTERLYPEDSLLDNPV
jgi:hypothetical protein